jgi:hypothetical protein
MPRNQPIQISKHANLCSFSLTRVSPYDVVPSPHNEGGAEAAEAVDLHFTVHPQLRQWLREQAEEAEADGKNTDALMFTDEAQVHQVGAYDVTPLDGWNLTAFNLSHSPVVHREDTPSLRFTDPWFESLSFLRYTVLDLTRTLRFTAARVSPREHARLWSLVALHPTVQAADEGDEAQITALEQALRTAFRDLRYQHIAQPITRTTTIQVS